MGFGLYFDGRHWVAEVPTFTMEGRCSLPEVPSTSTVFAFPDTPLPNPDIDTWNFYWEETATRGSYR